MEPGEKRIYGVTPSAVLHEFGHFLDYVLDYPSESQGLYEEEAEAAAVFLRDYALTGEREYFAEYFACYLRAGNDTERAAEMERGTMWPAEDGQGIVPRVGTRSNRKHCKSEDNNE